MNILMLINILSGNVKKDTSGKQNTIKYNKVAGVKNVR